MHVASLVSIRSLVLGKDYSLLYIETLIVLESSGSAVFCVDWLLGGKMLVCQEKLTKLSLFSQETLTKTL